MNYSLNAHLILLALSYRGEQKKTKKISSFFTFFLLRKYCCFPRFYTYFSKSINRFFELFFLYTIQPEHVHNFAVCYIQAINFYSSFFLLSFLYFHNKYCMFYVKVQIECNFISYKASHMHTENQVQEKTSPTIKTRILIGVPDGLQELFFESTHSVFSITGNLGNFATIYSCDWLETLSKTVPQLVRHPTIFNYTNKQKMSNFVDRILI